MKKALAVFCVVTECLLFLWLLVGLWACANKIKELEDEQKSIRAFAGLDAEEQKMVVSNMQHSIDLLAFRVTDIESKLEANR